MLVKTVNLDSSGVLKCIRYAFMPNQLLLCGPKKQADIFEYYWRSARNKKIKNTVRPLLMGFETMYPYLSFIAKESNKMDPFDLKVVEAYWLGNDLLDKINAKKYFKFLNDDLKINYKIGADKAKKLTAAFSNDFIPHHNYYVLEVFKDTGKYDDIISLNSLDMCRISTGKILKVSPEKVVVERKRILLDDQGKISISNSLQESTRVSKYKILPNVELKEGDFVSMHWGEICEKISSKKAKALEKITDRAVQIFNDNRNTR